MSHMNRRTFSVRAGLLALLFIILSAARLPHDRVLAQSEQLTSTPAAYVDPQFAPYQQLLASSQVPPTVYFKPGGFPRSILGSFPTEGADVVEQARNFIEAYKTLYLLDSPDLTLVTRTTTGEQETDESSIIFEQTYKGVKVYGAQLIVTLVPGRVFSTVGTLLTQYTPDLDIQPNLTRAEAETKARADVGTPDVPIVAESILLVYDPSITADAESAPHLVWRVITTRPNPWIVFVDAHTGEIVAKSDLNEYFDLDLEDANGRTAEDTSCYWWTSDDDEIGDEDGVYDEAANDAEAAAAWNNAWAAYNFYNDNFSLDSYDDDDGQLEVYVHSAPTQSPAQWIAGSTDCDLIEFLDGWVGLDVMVHEYTHGVIAYRAAGPLADGNQPGATNEGLADIMAAFADGNWLMADNTTGSVGYIRNLQNPPDKGDPDKMSAYVVTSADKGGIHTNMTIIGKAAYLIADGDTFNGFTINGIGRAKAMKLFMSVIKHIPQNVQFIDVRNTAVARAMFFTDPQLPGGGYLPGMDGPLYGFTAQDVCEIRNAFAAVELGNSDTNCDGVEENLDADNDSINDSADNCPVVWNASQLDDDKDGTGNACDTNFSIDADGDGVPEQCNGASCPLLPDNCPGVPNADQADSNFNGVGNACDPDEDGDYDDDTIPNAFDNCVFDYNPTQDDTDQDGDGDACDPDGDQDGISNDDDNCIGEPNYLQEDDDGDGLGNACDICPQDVDQGVAIGYFEDPVTGEIHYHTVYHDADGDGIPDSCDDTFTIDGLPAGGLFPDCLPHGFSVRGKPKSYLGVALSHYMEQPEHWYPLDARIVLTLEGMPDTVRTWILDDDARTLAESSEPGTRVLDFRPMGGQRYYLMFDFSPNVGENERIYFQGNMTLEMDQQTKCPPAPSRPTPPPSLPDNDGIEVSGNDDVSIAADCGGFRLASPREGMLNGMQQVYWDPAPGAEFYRVNLYNEGGALVFTQDVPAPTTMTTIDTRNPAIGEGTYFDLEVLALANNSILNCADRVRQPRALPPDIDTIPQVEPTTPPISINPDTPILVPICGNNICEIGEGNGACCSDCACIE